MVRYRLKGTVPKVSENGVVRRAHQIYSHRRVRRAHEI